MAPILLFELLKITLIDIVIIIIIIIIIRWKLPVQFQYFDDRWKREKPTLLTRVQAKHIKFCLGSNLLLIPNLLHDHIQFLN